ncbi:MAG: tetratricopeptide repeat protein [Phycisphaerae bacterium]
MKRCLRFYTAGLLLLSFALSPGLAQVPKKTTLDSSTTRAAAEFKLDTEKVESLLTKAKDALLKGNDSDTNKYLGELTQIAIAAGEQQQYETYENIFLRILKVKDDYPDALIKLADYYRQTNPMWAVDYYGRYLEVNPGNADAYYGRGSCYLTRGSYTLAIADLRYLVERLKPKDIGGLTNLALACWGRAGEINDPELYKQAVGYMKSAVQAAQETKNPEMQKKLPELKFRLGKLLLDYNNKVLGKAQSSEQKANLFEAIDILEHAIQEAKKAINHDMEGRQNLRQALLCYDVLSDVYTAMISMNPKDPAPYLQLAQITREKAALQLKESQILALNFYLKAVDADTKRPENLILLAKGYNELGQSKKAILTMDQAIKLVPDSKEYRKMRTQFVASTQPTTKPKNK